MIHPNTELRFISDEIGYGVVATRFIPKGTVTWVKDKLDRTFSIKRFKAFPMAYQNILEKYCYNDRKGNYVLCWDISRFVNHSFNSSCLTTPYEFEIAVRDIHPGEELTDDYGYLNVAEPFDCIPEQGSERTRVYPDDLLKYHSLWDEQLFDSMRLYSSVAQPLEGFIKPSTLKRTKEIEVGKRKMDSILNCYYDRGRVMTRG